jgi:hypothetical protein
MIGRRGFITGLISLVAAPAIVRAEEPEPGQEGYFKYEEFRDKTFDWRGGDLPCVVLEECRFICCVFIFGPETHNVSFSDCSMASCIFAGVANQDNSNTVTHCYLEDCIFDTGWPDGGHDNLKCAAPVS